MFVDVNALDIFNYNDASDQGHLNIKGCISILRDIFILKSSSCYYTSLGETVHLNIRFS